MKLLEGGKSMRKPEILAPAGNLEKLKIAIDFGADAVYLSLIHISEPTRP